MNPLSKQLGLRFRALRRQQFNSQQACAKRCRELNVPVTRNMIAKWETGRAEIPSALVPLLAHVLRSRVADLLPEYQPETNPHRPLLLPPDGENPPLPSATAANSSLPAVRRSPEHFFQNLRHQPTPGVITGSYDGRSPFELLVWQDTCVLLRALIRDLDRRHRQVLLLYYFGGLKLQEIAAKLQLTESTVITRRNRACEKIRQTLFCHGRGHWLLAELLSQFPIRNYHE